MKRRLYVLSYTVFATCAGMFTKYFGVVVIAKLPEGAKVSNFTNTRGWEMRMMPAMKFGLKRGIALVNATQVKNFKRRAKNHQIAIYES
jgi:hypothetical protein